MRAFARLLDRLSFTPSRNDKLTLIADYLRDTPDPDRGWALAALTGDLDLRSITPSRLRQMVEGRIDAELFRLSYDYVGDLAETIALIWPETETDAQRETTPPDIPLSQVVTRLQAMGRANVPAEMAQMLDALAPEARFALLKLVTGGLRVGVSAQLAKTALARFGEVELTEIVELWHGLTPPYTDLFAWLTGGEKPVNAARAPFRPVMLSTATDLDQLQALDPAEHFAEWKWDGIRVQAVAEAGTRRIYSRTGEDISGAFPDLVEAMEFEGALDGELLVRQGTTGVGSFADLQKRLNRKTVSKALLKSNPAMLRAYDLLVDGGDDIRALPQTARRARLETFLAPLDPARFDLSPLIPFTTWDDVAQARDDLPDPVIEGVMIKRRDTPYLAGRSRGPWFKWKRDPYLIDAILLYAQRGHGKRSGFYSDYTFGVWKGNEIVPVGKAYFGFTDEELKQLDRFIRDNTRERFGPVRSVTPDLVLEIAFEGLNRSPRHKSGVAMRFPRVHRIRWDKPAQEADHLSTLEAMLPPEG
ncbi:ATP-dependent DNA ligase [Pacificitalea manganoxidans]|uniref:DNA ligase (ATP) n=1 Tax=Pacificitalea manganoxidans TaxID=1411902 RepID=A0A291LWN7_9RHOB|nr:cisplatin damage response ATP-dependent DNA ligase [Pacificitalea manganoxidans]ATI41074.1 ATP-dependent DNA ligase [Pacificitalea manganoxidans]MDR6308441.1 DNA ligase-1 [Pacificitalea manganoxidans]